LYTYSYYTLEACFNQSWIMYYITKTAYYIGIDNVFIDASTIGKYKLYPVTNGLSEHDKEKECHTDIKRKINKYTRAVFQWKWSHEMCKQVFDGNDVNKIFD